MLLTVVNMFRDLLDLNLALVRTVGSVSIMPWTELS